MAARAKGHDPACLLRFSQGVLDLLLRVSRPHVGDTLQQSVQRLAPSRCFGLLA